VESAAAEDPRRSIGRYEVLGELGHGGMAVVYRARDSKLLREVAVKVLHPHLASDLESRQRFLREAQAAARLRHPNIVEVFDFSVEADRESFMVTELLDGPTLRRFAEGRAPLPAEVVAAIGMVLCDALSCAHAMGVVHRDVKPDNILLHKGGVLKLTDFGIAHLTDGGGMTVTGQILGSPAHMAPEQIEGASVDARTDLFSLGTVLYALSVGRLPFEAPMAHALLRKILEADYPDPARIEPKVGDRFSALVRRCMARRPEDRFVDAASLRGALGEFCRDAEWEDPKEQLEAFFAGPETFCDAHNAGLIERLARKGRLARDAGRIPEAMGYFNRALAHDPSNAKVIELVRSVARRRQRERTARAVALVGVTAALTATSAAWGLRALRRAPAAASTEGHGALATRGDAASMEPAATTAALARDALDGGSSRIAQDRGEDGAASVSPTLLVAEPAANGSTDGEDSAVPRFAALARVERLAPRSGRVDASAPGVLARGMIVTARGAMGTRTLPAINARTLAGAGRVLPVSGVAVRFAVRGIAGLLSIDGHNPREHDNGDEYQLAPGWHTVQLVPADTSCGRPPVWRVQVQPTPEGGPLRLVSPRFSCVPAGQSVAP
jgi:tRNA A-37 threonylcarbamoyl transferase component Bud32